MIVILVKNITTDMIGTPSFKTTTPILEAWLTVKKIGTLHIGKIMKTKTPTFIEG